MKKYSTTLLNGFILGISTMLFIGAKSQDKNLGDITANSLRVVDKNNVLKAEVYVNDEGNPIVSMRSNLGFTSITSGAIQTRNIEGNPVIFIGSNSNEGGVISVKNKEGKELASISSGLTGFGIIQTFNSKGNQSVYIGSDIKNEDGLIQISDRYGDVGWGATGKR